MSDDFSDGAPSPKDCYYSLANEMTGTEANGDPITWREDDWDAAYVRRARIYAESEDLPFPPPPIASGWVMTIYTMEGASNDHAA